MFATAGKPKDLFQQCLTQHELETAGSYLIILQNLETSAISRQFATILLETSLEEEKWDLAKELVRFLRAIGNNIGMKRKHNQFQEKPKFFISNF